MTDVLTSETALLAAICILAALAAARFLRPPPANAARRYALAPDDPSGPVFLFDDSGLIDASVDPAGLPGLDGGAADWSALADALRPAYPALPAEIGCLDDGDCRVVSARDGLVAGDILVERVGPVTRLRLSPDSLAPSPDPAAAAPELDMLRQAMDATPYPVWRRDAQGSVVWYNSAYATLAGRVRGRDTPLAEPLFATDSDGPKPGCRTRMSIAPPDQPDHKLWFDVTMIRQPAGDLFCAADINAVVDAELAQRNFVQTLAKTFAQLSIGLAIFDRNRQLALFNPALIDLTSLPAEFLSARPTLLCFFDRLRDRRTIPEPKNYENWRRQMADLVAAAADGRYQETWSLPSGSVYSVSGRPHPDGAVAFLIEDITAEVTLTRRFRAELELGQSILDRLDEAIAVFAQDGTMTFSNEPFHDLWGVDPDRGFAQMTIVDLTRTWQDRCAPTPVWGELRDFVGPGDNRADWWAEVRLRTGEALTCHVHPINSGATMVRFAGCAGSRRDRPDPTTTPAAEPNPAHADPGQPVPATPPPDAAGAGPERTSRPAARPRPVLLSHQPV